MTLLMTVLYYLTRGKDDNGIAYSGLVYTPEQQIRGMDVMKHGGTANPVGRRCLG